MPKQLLLMLCLASLSATAQVTVIPDPAFEQILINQNIDTDGVINGQMVTTDALGITNLVISSPEGEVSTEWIYDLTGIEAFTDIENLTVNFTMIEELNVDALINLKYLDCVDNMLTSLDVSNNPLLEQLRLFLGGDVLPMNNISAIDLSNNPQMHTLEAYGIEFINLKNGNNNSNMYIDISAGTWEMPLEFINGHTCIEVDHEEAAQNDEFPYSQWTIIHDNQSFNMEANCELGNGSFISDNSISVYPNPASEKLYFNIPEGVYADKAVLYDISGRAVKEFTNTDAGISIAGLARGIYVIQILSGNTMQTQKVILE